MFYRLEFMCSLFIGTAVGVFVGVQHFCLGVCGSGGWSVAGVCELCPGPGVFVCSAAILFSAAGCICWPQAIFVVAEEIVFRADASQSIR